MALTETEKTVEKRWPYVPAQFKPGNPGRPKGSRNKLGEEFVAALQADFMEHGASVIQTVRTEKPDVYLKVIAQVIPKEMTIKTDTFDGITDEQLSAIVAAARDALGLGESGLIDITDASVGKQAEELQALPQAEGISRRG